METHQEVQTTKRHRGFTLVELLIVIVIFGVLATVTVFAVRGITDKGTQSACAADTKTLQVAAESYFAQYGSTAIPVTGGALPMTTPPVTWMLGGTAGETLKNAGFLRSESTKYTVNPNGTLTNIAPCPA